MNQDKIIARIQKLLAMSEDASSPNEAAIAASRAAKMLQQHNLERAEVMSKDLSTDDLTEAQSDIARKTMPNWIANLIVPVAKLHDCEARYARSDKGLSAEFLGQKEDVLVAKYVYEYLVAEIKRLTSVFAKGGTPRKDVREFRQGASDAVITMVRQMQAEKDEAERNHQAGTALVVVKNQLIAEKYNLSGYKQSKRRTGHYSESYANGVKQGRGISVRSGISGSAAPTGIR